MSFKILQEKIDQKNNAVVMGLDPKLEFIPDYLIEECNKDVCQAIFKFNKILIDSTVDLIPAIKPQSAYYEMYGFAGLHALYDTIDYAKSKDLYVILDAKRGDIGATSEAYSSAYLGEAEIFGERKKGFDCDCLTVNPYLGIDGVQPFIDDCLKFDKAIFVLVKTSNKSSGDFQDIKIQDGRFLYEKVADTIVELGNNCNINYKYNSVGAVVGATYPEQLKSLRTRMKSTFFLVPGFGAQGGAADDVKHAFDSNGEGAIVNSSRGIMCAGKGKDPRKFGDFAREEVLRMQQEINKVR